jgi:hypothetical protein
MSSNHKLVLVSTLEKTTKEADLARILRILCAIFLMIGIQLDQKAHIRINKIDLLKIIEGLPYANNLQQTVGEKIVFLE